MLERKFKIILLALTAALLLCASGIVAACSVEKTPLAAPQNLRLEEGFLVWDEVANAEYYVVKCNYKECETAECRYDLSALNAPGEYQIKVLAASDGNQFKDSEWSDFAYTAEEEKPLNPTANLYYKFLPEQGGYEVSRGGANLNGTVVIPEYYNGYPVIRIAKRAFDVRGLNSDPNPEGNKKTTGFVLPSTIKEIGYGAFQYCRAITEIRIPEGVTVIEHSTFYSCSSLKKVELPSTLKKIEKLAFLSCALIKVELPESVEVVETGAFAECSSLAEVSIPQNVQFDYNVFWDSLWVANQPQGFVVVNGQIIAYSGKLPNGLIQMPAGITYLPNYLFYGQEVEYVTVPAGVTLGIGVFINCKNLKEADLSGAISLGKRTFEGCSSLTKAILPAGLDKVPSETFAECDSLISYFIGDKEFFIADSGSKTN